MFAPTKIWRRWHRKINTNEKRYAICSAIAATAIPSLVLARGHRVERIAEIPFVVDNKAFDNVDKTARAVALFKTLGVFDDVQKAKDSTRVRAGKGKMRNRRFVQRKGPLVIYNEKGPIINAIRNLPGVESVAVSRLNLLQLAPGGHLGRFCIWTRDAFERLDAIYGTYRKPSSEKLDYTLPRSIVANVDLGRIINSDEIQSALREKVPQRRVHPHRKNPLKNLGFRIKLNPYAKTERRQAILTQQRQAAKKAASVESKRKGQKTDPKAKAIRKKLNARHAKFRTVLLSKK